jgi:hypothetical protein
VQRPGLPSFLRRQGDIVLLTVVVALVLAAGLTALQPERYAATASVVLSPVAFLEPGASDAMPALADTVIAVAQSPAVLRDTGAAYAAAAPDAATRAERRSTATGAWLRDHVALRPVGTSAVLEITATAGTPGDAQALANAAVTTLVGFITDLRDRTTPPGNPDRVGVRAVTTSTGERDGWVSPSPLRNEAIAVLVGLLIGSALALWVDRRSRRAAPRRVAAALRLPWLGTVPAAEHDGADGRALRHFLEALKAAERSPGHVALVTGSGPSKDISHVARSAVRSLNGSTNRALILDGAAVGHALGHRWPEYAFVVISGPSTTRGAELLALARRADSVVLAVSGDDPRVELDRLRAVARAAADGGAAVGVVGVAAATDHPSSPS